MYIVLAFFIALLLISFSVFSFVKKKEDFNPEWGSFRDGEGSDVITKLENHICEGDSPPEYYAGCYLLKQNVIVLLKEGYESKEGEVRSLLGANSVYIRYVKYSLQELRNSEQKFARKYEEIYGQGEENERKIKALFGNNKMIVYRNN